MARTLPPNCSIVKTIFNDRGLEKEKQFYTEAQLRREFAATNKKSVFVEEFFRRLYENKAVRTVDGLYQLMATLDQQHKALARLWDLMEGKR